MEGITINIMVFDVPASSAGALSILKDFHDEIKTHPNDKINWFFVISTPELEETENIKVLRFPWVKKSWIHRLYFDHFIAGKLIKKYNIDKVLSFQNVIVSHTKVPQVLYVHQPLPFVDYRFSFRENRAFWAYQNPIGRLIKKSIINSERTIVQTDWMRQACIEQTGVNSSKIKVLPPKINTEIKGYFKPDKSTMKSFFFPSGGQSYKNHKVIIEACKELKQEGITDYNVLFTLDKDESEHVAALYREVRDLNLPIKFIGKIPREDVFRLYTESVLLFPSYIETFGLPMLEARLHRGIVFASNCPFSNEILDSYENAYFFDPFLPDELKTLMENIIKGEIKYTEPSNDIVTQEGNGWVELLRELY